MARNFINIFVPNSIFIARENAETKIVKLFIIIIIYIFSSRFKVK